MQTSGLETKLCQNSVKNYLRGITLTPKTLVQEIAASVLDTAVANADTFRKRFKDLLSDDHLRNAAQAEVDQYKSSSVSTEAVLSSVRGMLLDTLFHNMYYQSSYLESVALYKEIPPDILAEYAFRYRLSSNNNFRHHHKDYVYPELRAACLRDDDFREIASHMSDISIQSVNNFFTGNSGFTTRALNIDTIDTVLESQVSRAFNEHFSSDEQSFRPNRRKTEDFETGEQAAYYVFYKLAHAIITTRHAATSTLIMT